MKRMFVFATLLILATSAQAQWQNSPTLSGAVYNNGNVGIGVSHPLSVVHANANIGMNVQLGYYATLGTVYSSWATVIGNNVRARQSAVGELENMVTHSTYGGSAIVLNGAYGISFHTKQGAVTAGATYSSERMVITESGNVGIGIAPNAKLHVNGDIVATGNIAAKYQDVAEWVPAEGELAPGTVVIVAPRRENVVMAAAEAYDTRVAGVVSLQPGLILGEPGASKVQVATTGRVKVKADATGGPIAAGDLLVSSGRSGYAMKSVPMDINGRKFHQPGTLIGKALEPLEGGEGEILVLLSLQ